jgi:hypothetical protein
MYTPPLNIPKLPTDKFVSIFTLELKVAPEVTVNSSKRAFPSTSKVLSKSVSLILVS